MFKVKQRVGQVGQELAGSTAASEFQCIGDAALKVTARVRPTPVHDPKRTSVLGPAWIAVSQMYFFYACNCFRVYYTGHAYNPGGNETEGGRCV